jgi:hypothetical protein
MTIVSTTVLTRLSSDELESHVGRLAAARMRALTPAERDEAGSALLAALAERARRTAAHDDRGGHVDQGLAWAVRVQQTGACGGT